MNKPENISARAFNVTDMLCFDIYSANQAFGQVYKDLLNPLGITYPQYLVFVSLWAKDRQTVSEIGSNIGLESSTLTPLIKRLEQKGLVVRKRDEGDERKVIVSLTPRGMALEEEAQLIPECVARATGLTVTEIAHLQQLLTKTRTTLSSRTD